MEGIDSLADEVGVLGGEFGGIEAGNDTDESGVTLDVVAPMVLAQTEAKDVVKLCFGLGQLDVGHHMGLRLLVQEPVVTVTLYVSKLCLEGLAFYMLWFQPTMLEAWEHDVITILNLLDFHIVYCLVNRSVSFTRIVLPPLPTKRPVGELHEPLLMQLSGCKYTKIKLNLLLFSKKLIKSYDFTWKL